MCCPENACCCLSASWKTFQSLPAISPDTPIQNRWQADAIPTAFVPRCDTKVAENPKPCSELLRQICWRGGGCWDLPLLSGGILWQVWDSSPPETCGILPQLETGRWLLVPWATPSAPLLPSRLSDAIYVGISKAEGNNKEGDRLSSKVCCDRRRGNDFKLKEWFKLDVRKKIFTIRVMRHWHRLPRDVLDAQSLETPKVRLDGAPSTWWSCGCPCSLQEVCTRCPLRGPSNSNDALILWYMQHQLLSAYVIPIWLCLMWWIWGRCHRSGHCCSSKSGYF